MMNNESGELGHEQSRDEKLKSFAEQESLDRLSNEGIENLDFAFAIQGELGAAKQPIKADVFWTRFKKPEEADLEDTAAVEGKLYLPENPNGELILFTPGFPGGNAGRFEMRYAQTFVDAGYSFFTVRHNGTNLLKEDTAPEIINSAKRIEIAKQMQDQHIGGTRQEGYPPSTMVKEPITPLMGLYKKFKKINLMGQSMGVAANYHAVSRMKNHPEALNKIKNVVGIAGYVGGEEGTEGQYWDGMKMPMDELAAYEFKYIAQVGTNTVRTEQEFKDSMRQVAHLNENMEVPPHIGNALVFTPKDPLIAGPDKEQPDYALNYGPKSMRKLIIRDETALEDKKPHSMLWISPQNLLRAVKAEVSGHGPHYIKVPSSNPNAIEKG